MVSWLGHGLSSDISSFISLSSCRRVKMPICDEVSLETPEHSMLPICCTFSWNCSYEMAMRQQVLAVSDSPSKAISKNLVWKNSTDGAYALKCAPHDHASNCSLLHLRNLNGKDQRKMQGTHYQPDCAETT